MIECLVLGDSIAVGLGAQLRACVTDAQVGIGSAAIVGRAGPADVAVISAGSNDPHNPRLEANLRMIRAKVRGRVVWIVPQHRVAADAVTKVARFHGDQIVSFAPSQDRVHPRSYRELAASVRPRLARD